MHLALGSGRRTPPPVHACTCTTGIHITSIFNNLCTNRTLITILCFLVPICMVPVHSLLLSASYTERPVCAAPGVQLRAGGAGAAAAAAGGGCGGTGHGGYLRVVAW